MSVGRVSFFAVVLGFVFVHAEVSFAQNETAAPQPATTQQQTVSNQQEDEKVKLERRAVALLEQVVSEAQALKLPENRVRFEIAAGDLLWTRNQARARGLFSDAGAAIAQVTWQTDRGDRDEAEKTARLRRDLVLTVARHDADLAFRLLYSTRPFVGANDAANDTESGTDSDTSLGQTLLAIIASSHPEGNTDRALQIATDHLNESGRNTITQAVERKKAAMDSSPDKLAKIREMLAGLSSDSARVRTLIDLAAAAEKDNPKLALMFLDDAHDIVSKRAGKYRDFEDQLEVAEALAAVDLKRSFDVLELGIAQLNEILEAAAVVNGFEAEVFREGELPVQGGSELGNMVARYGWELGSLARLDFDHAKMTADKFQLSESRLLTKLLIAQRVLGVKQNSFDNSHRNQAAQGFSISVSLR